MVPPPDGFPYPRDDEFDGRVALFCGRLFWTLLRLALLLPRFPLLFALTLLLRLILLFVRLPLLALTLLRFPPLTFTVLPLTFVLRLPERL